MAPPRVVIVSAAIAWVSAGLAYLTLEAVAAAAFRPTYSYTRNFISDLGVGPQSPLAWLMNMAFCVQGTLFLVGAVLGVRAFTPPRARLFLALAAANTVGNLLIAVFHSGPSAWAHAVGAVLAIVGGNAAILAGSSIVGGWHRKVSVGLGVFGLLSFVLLVVELKTSASNPGLSERCSVYSITVWQLITGVQVLSQRPTIRNSGSPGPRWSRLDL